MLEPHLHTLAALIAAQPDRTLAETEGRPRHARECADGLACRTRPRPDRQKKRSAHPNTIGLTSRRRASRGMRRRRPGIRPPRVSGRNRHHEQSAPTIRPRPARGACPRPRPLRALADQHVLAALRVTGLTAPGVFDGVIDGESFRAYIDRSWCRPCTPATSSSPTTSARTRSPVSSEPSRLPGPRSGICRPIARTSIRSSCASRS